MTFSRAELLTYRGKTLPDLVPERVSVLFVGINPGLLTVAVQAHFSRRGNRFYPALYRAGIVDRLIDASHGFDPDDLHHLMARGIGITSIVAGATARADELTVEELTAGAAALESRVAAMSPRAVALLGISAYRLGFRRPRATAGLQTETLAGRPLWVVPNPSGLNAHETPASLAAAYRSVALAAGLDLFDVTS
ncbi:MAG: mismatch-specific DNA-glycosylase [Frondihabitans sp.]|nr:mismatch-specific DNA-glycosylase [Frondihabitans sp.]